MRPTCHIFFLAALLLTATRLTAGEADSTRCAFEWQASVNAGYLMPDGKVDATLPDGTAAYPLSRPVLGAKLSMDIRPGRKLQGLSDWNDATPGVALDYLNMGNNRWLGSIIAPYTYLRIPIIRLPHFELGLRPGIGLAFSTKTYRSTIPDDLRYQVLCQQDGQTVANQCIGSVTNFYFAEALYLAFPLKDGFSIIASSGWYHVSNGSTIQPNSGYNMLNAEIGVSYTPAATIRAKRYDTQRSCYDNEESKESRERAKRFPKRLPYEGGWDFEASVAGGFRQVYYKDRKTFGVGSISLAAHWRPWAIFRIGGGVDVFFDGAYLPRETKFGKTALTLATPADCWRMGISVQPEFVVGRFSVGFHVGAYLLDGVKNLEAGTDEEAATLASGQRLQKPLFYRYNLLKAGSAGYPDGWLYTRILLKYRVTDHFFVQLGMKAHLTKAEFVSAGVGFAISK